ncbi:MAG: EF-P lysine aminoacylase GenX [Nitrococcus sp.]|nr:EF-P lysine aminoacylase GenX [Nitrococcus sp.]
MRDDWRPTACLDALRERASTLAAIRGFFAERGVLEVDTPSLAAAGAMDPNLQSLAVDYDGPGAPPGGRLWLQSSPEHAMKRLLAAGAGSIYQITHAFRAGERGRLHNPEFTLLEWYRLGWDHHALMSEVADLVRCLLGKCAVERLSYSQAFRIHLGVDPLEAPRRTLEACAGGLGMGRSALAGLSRDALLDLLLSERVVPALRDDRLTFIYDFPASQAALARLCPDDSRVAERFELFSAGIELANGYHELTDAGEQRVRFDRERALRARLGLALPDIDERLLAAMDAGLPACAGVAVGLDRLLMRRLGAGHIDDVIAFPIERA